MIAQYLQESIAKKFEDNFNIKISKSSICRVLKDNGFVL